MSTISGRITTLDSALDGTLGDGSGAVLNGGLTSRSVSFGGAISRGGIEAYTGDYEVTPTQSTQTLSTSGLRMTQNVKINPIPSNYGLIEWDGSSLKVS